MPLQIEDFTNEVRGIVYSLKERQRQDPESYLVSDIRMDNPDDPDLPLQFVDLVQEGGGILGIALVGYTYVLEEMGIRFASLAGTSAGSINTILLAALGKPHERKSDKILRILANKDFSDFMDGGWDVRQLVGALASPSRIRKWFGGMLAAASNLNEVLFQDGLNPGNAFYQWMEGVLSGASMDTTEKLLTNMNDFPEAIRPQFQDAELAQLAIIAADITTETKVQFPRMSELYFAQPTTVHPAQFVRASMSIPLFFSPVRLDLTGLPRTSTGYSDRWSAADLGAGYYGPIPEEVLLVDGGIMSNFPIDVFHDWGGIPKRPTFGVRLGLERNDFNRIDSMLDIINACFEGARNIRDAETIQSSADFKEIIGFVDVGQHNWLNFSIDDDAKLDLFRRGAQAASDFLQRFDWKKYKQIRRQQLLTTGQDSTRALFAESNVLWRVGLHHDKKILSKLERCRKVGYQPAILWIDNEPANDFIELQSLQSLGIGHYTATTSQEASRVLDRHRIDLIVTDSNREGNPQAGLAYCQQLLQTRPAIPVILRSMTLADQRKHIQATYPNIVAQTGEIKELLRQVVLHLPEPQAVDS
jgi:NTE family protein